MNNIYLRISVCSTYFNALRGTSMFALESRGSQSESQADVTRLLVIA